jgi:alginate O-acetyltransferase complex protein AlgI
VVFSGLPFLFFFLPSALALYYLAPRRAKNGVLCFVSVIFYAWGEPVYVTLMLLSIAGNFAYGRWAERHGPRRPALALIITFNLGLLGFFKYAGFLAESLNVLGAALPVPELPLPIGISFYTFQALSYVIDVFRGRCAVQRSLLDFGCYLAMFPQLIAGPIVRYISVAEQLRLRRENIPDFTTGIRLFAIGLGKKVLLANQFGLLWETCQSRPTDSLTFAAAWLGITAFACQIYFDFSGYSDMALGLGRMFGFTFPLNFRYPYAARSVTEFWRRWHITLSAWFREYVYIPLGGNRVSAPRHILNIAVVWTLTGIWHGAAWNFALWGAYFGLLLILEKYVLKNRLERIPACCAHIYCLIAVLVSWVFFSFTSAAGAVRYLSLMFGGASAWSDDFALYQLISYGPLLIAGALGATRLPVIVWEKLTRGKPALSAWLGAVLTVGVLLLSLAYIVNSGYNPFLYFRF